MSCFQLKFRLPWSKPAFCQRMAGCVHKLSNCSSSYIAMMSRSKHFWFRLLQVKAEVKHGLLHVVLPRKPGPEPTVIPVGGTDGEEGFVSVAERAS